VNEDDRAEIGKGHEFPTQLFRSHYNMPPFELSKYASSEFLAWAMCFSMGNVHPDRQRSLYVCHRSGLGRHERDRPRVSGLSFVQQIRPGGSAVLDEMLVGCAVKSWKLSIKNSPGRASAMLLVGMHDQGQYTSPSASRCPAVSTPHEFNAGMITALTFTGSTTFRAAARSSSSPWKRPGKQLPARLLPMARVAQDGLPDPGRFQWEIAPSRAVSWCASQAGSTELIPNLINLTTGTATFTMARDANNSFSCSSRRGGFSVASWEKHGRHRDAPDHRRSTLRRHHGLVTDDHHHAVNGHLPIGVHMESRKESGLRRNEAVVSRFSQPVKDLRVRFPSDEIVCAWARAQRLVRHFLGRGKIAK